MYANHDETVELFNRVNVNDMDSPAYQAHVLRVANAFDDVINKLHNHQVIDHMLDHLANAHSKRSGLKKVYFDVSWGATMGRPFVVGVGAGV